MSHSPAISVHNVSKVYRLYDRPQDRLKQSFFRHFGKKYGREFWALRNVHFEVQRGETLGIIGRNGSGKSTLLQIIAGILTPSGGDIEVKGRVSALLELGSGFNPEYTGRENVFMNGALMGISKRDMEKRIEEIISFAELGEFIDQPVKVYSSGMFVRLAFAVTTGLDADILLIDEALAVGDVFFRQKCYQRLEVLRERGISIVLVSHAMTEVEQFCQRALLLHYGDVLLLGTAAEVVKRYYLIEQEDRLLNLSRKDPPLKPRVQSIPESLPRKTDFWPDPGAFLPVQGIRQASNGWARCTGVALCTVQGQPCNVFEQGETATFFYEFELDHDLEVPTGGVEIQNDRGIVVHGKSTLEYDSKVPTHVPKGSRLRFRQDITLEIAVGEYTFNLGLGALTLQDYQQRGTMTHADLDARLVRVCLLTAIGMFAVGYRKNTGSVRLMHHGVANLPGKCQVMVEKSFESGNELVSRTIS